MAIETNPATGEEVEALRRKISEYERWFRFLDGQNRVLERERQKLSTVLNQTDAGFLVVEPSLRVAWTNEVFTTRFRSAGHQGEIVGETCQRVLCRRDFPCESCPVATALATGRVAHSEIQYEAADQHKFLYATAMPIKSPVGDTEEAIVMIQDVSDLEVLRRSQEALRASEEQFRRLVETVKVIPWELDLKRWRFTYVGPQAVELLGYPIEEWQAEGFWAARLHADDREEAVRFCREAAERGESHEREYRMVAADGREVWMRDIVSVEMGEGGPSRLRGVMVDITERRAAEEALRRSEARKGAIFETSLDAIITIDHQGKILEFNTMAERMFGYTRVEVMGREMADLVIPAGLRERHRNGLANYAATGNSSIIGKRIEIMAMRSDGTEFPAEVAITRVSLPGAPLFTGYVHDLTERKKADEVLRQREDQLRQSQKMEAIGTLAGGVAHDFNNILTGILGQAELIRLRANDDRTVHAVSVIEKAAHRAADLTQQLLGFARRGKNQNVSVDVQGVLAEVIGLLGRTIDKNIVIEQHPCDRPARVLGDPGQVLQVLLNLAVNARDAMPEGGTLILATAVVTLGENDLPSRTAPPGEYVLISVSDTGHGIPDEIRDRIFEPFFTTKDLEKGTGMGLAMVYGIVRNHGGAIAVESEPSRGTTFHVYLPLAEADVSAGPERRVESSVRGAGRVLVVDDEECVREVTAEYLRLLGYEVVTASEGREAVEYFAEHTADIDLVLLDMVMPKMGARDCFRALKRIDPNVRAVLTTGYSINVSVQQILDEGMRGFIQKPFQIGQLSQVVASALAR